MLNIMTSQKDENRITSLITRCIQHSILNLCNEQVSFCRTLHVLGVLSLTIDSQEQEIIIKINDTLKKRDSPGPDENKKAPIDDGSDALTDSSTEPLSGEGEEFQSRPVETETCNDAFVEVKANNLIQSDTSYILMEDSGDTSRRDVEETPISFLKMRGRKQRKPIKLNKNASNGVANKPSDDDDNMRCYTDDVNMRVRNIIPDGVTFNNQSCDVGGDIVAQKKRQNSSVSDDDVIESKSTPTQKAIDLTKNESTPLAINLIKRERSSPSSPSFPLEESHEIPMNCAIDCSSKSAHLSKLFQIENNRNTVENYVQKRPNPEVFPDDKCHSNESDVQPLSVRELLTSNSHRPNSMIGHLEKIAAFQRYANFYLDGSDYARSQKRLDVSQSLTPRSQISTQMPQPIVIEPIYRKAGTESYQHQQPIWACNDVQETALNFSIKALNGESEKHRHSPSNGNQQNPFQLSPSYTHHVMEYTASPPHLKKYVHPDRPEEMMLTTVQPISISQSNYIFGGYRIPSHNMLSNNFQSFFKRTDNVINASNRLVSQNVTDELRGNGLRSTNLSSLFTQNAAMFQNGHRLFPRRALPGSLAWCPPAKIHQKRLRKAIVNSNKVKKIMTNADMTNKDISHDVQQTGSPQKSSSSSKIEGQYLVDSMSPEITRKRRRRGLDEALTSDEIAEYMGVEVDGTTPTVFACKYCTEESPDLCAYLSHTITAHGSYICHQCAKIFTTKSSLLRHRPIHTGMRRFTCSICQRAFYRKDKCKAHIKKHLEMTEEDGETHRQENIHGLQLAPINNSVLLGTAPMLSLAV